MIKVSIHQDKEVIKHILIEGHADFDEYGKDLVCAGVSTAIVGIYNELEKRSLLNTGTFHVESGYCDFLITKPCAENQLILETLVTILETIEFSYGEFIQINKEA